MATYPSGIYSPRTKNNKDGVVYTPTEDKTLYAEDIVYDDDEIVAIETELGLNPSGIYDTVKLNLEALWQAIADFASSFLDLTDTPSTYTDKAGKVVAVNVGENALEFVDQATANKCTGAEINTGTDDDKFATPKAIADSDIAMMSDIPSVPVKATGAEINTGTDDDKFATPKAIADSDIAMMSDIPSVPVKATGAEIDTGTDDDKFATPKAIEDSGLAKTSEIPVKATGAEIDTGTDDDKFATPKALKDSKNVPSVAPGADGNVLTSDGTDWTSEAPAGGDVGGLYGINVETLTGNKTLTPGTDEIYQYLDEGGANRTITLDTASASAGDKFIIRHNGVYNDSHYLWIKQGVTVLDYIFARSIRVYIFDGTNWVAGDVATGIYQVDHNVSFGYKSESIYRSVAIGYDSSSDSDSVVIGYQATGHYNSVSVGKNAESDYYGVALGYYCDTNAKRFSIALGYYSKCYRFGETSINIDADSTQKNNVIQVRFSKSTSDATPIEMLCAGYSTQRCTIRPSSVLAFTGIVTARDNVSGDCAAYKIEGAIKRDAAGNTAMLAAATVTVIHEDDATWDVTVAADDTNNALVITVTGDDTNPTQWAARIDGVETHF